MTLTRAGLLDGIKSIMRAEMVKELIGYAEKGLPEADRRQMWREYLRGATKDIEWPTIRGTAEDAISEAMKELGFSPFSDEKAPAAAGGPSDGSGL